MTVVIGAATYPENILEQLKKDHQVHFINGAEISNKLGNSKVLNSVVLGASAKFIGFDKQTWLDVVSSTVPPKTIEINTKAFLEGYNL